CHLLEHDRDRLAVDAGTPHQGRGTFEVLGVDGVHKLLNLVDTRELLQDQRAFKIAFVHGMRGELCHSNFIWTKEPWRRLMPYSSQALRLQSMCIQPMQLREEAARPWTVSGQPDSVTKTVVVC